MPIRRRRIRKKDDVSLKHFQ